MLFYSKNACVNPVLTAVLVSFLLGSVPAPAGPAEVEDRAVPHTRRAGLSSGAAFTWMASLER